MWSLVPPIGFAAVKTDIFFSFIAWYALVRENGKYCLYPTFLTIVMALEMNFHYASRDVIM